MYSYSTYIYHFLLFITVCVTSPAVATNRYTAPEGVHITLKRARIALAHYTPLEVRVANDSLHLLLEMDLNPIRTKSSVAMLFTPMLSGARGELALPPVIVTGASRFRFDRREWALQQPDAPLPLPYLVIKDNRKRSPHPVQYRQSVPYASWMADASLLIQRQVKDCCDLSLLGYDTLSLRLSTLTGDVPVQALPTQPQVVQQRPVEAPQVVQQYSLLQPVASPNYVLLPSVAPAYSLMVSYLTPDATPARKPAIEHVVLYIDYPRGHHDVIPDYHNNRAELKKLDALFASLTNIGARTPASASEGSTSVQQIQVCGFSSPDGNYADNERLSNNRSRLFAQYLYTAYHFPRQFIHVTSVGEDWGGLQQLLHTDRPPYADRALDIIERVGIFSGREKQLMDLQGGQPYRDMLLRFFPRLRRIEVTLHTTTQPATGSESIAADATRLIYTHPEQLSLAQMYEVARYYRPGTEQYREVYEIAAHHFPNDVVARVNAASAVLLTGDLKSARDYLSQLQEEPRAWNNLGVLALMEGDRTAAEAWFRKAVGIEPQKARANLKWIQKGN